MNISYINIDSYINRTPDVDTLISGLNSTMYQMSPSYISEHLKIDYRKAEKSRSKILVLIGKNALEYESHLENKFQSFFDRIYIFQAKGYTTENCTVGPTSILFSQSHPVPDDQTFANTSKFLKMVMDVDKPSYFHFLVTGGTSSCLAYPEEGISHETYRQIVSHFLKSGIDIFELNQIRSLIDSLKGGKLAAILDDHFVETSIISDVFTNQAHYVGSGPTVAGIAPTKNLLNVLHTFSDKFQIPVDWDKLNSRLISSSEQVRKDHAFRILSSNLHFCNVLHKLLVKNGKYNRVQIIDTEINQTAEDFALQIAKYAKTTKSDSVAIWGGELKFSLPKIIEPHMLGGRLSAFSYHLAEYIDGLTNVLVIAMATDGQDGSSPDPIYVITGETMNQLAYDPILESPDFIFSTGALFKNAHASISCAPTGLNYADLFILVKFPHNYR